MLREWNMVILLAETTARTVVSFFDNRHWMSEPSKSSREPFADQNIKPSMRAGGLLIESLSRRSGRGKPVEGKSMQERVVRAKALDAVPDADLLGLAGAGETEAFVALMRRHNRRLYRVARGAGCADLEAEDVVQTAWLQAFAAARGFRGESKVSTWLVRIVLNEAFGRRRRQRPMIELEKLDERPIAEIIAFPSNGDNPEASAERSQIRRMLEKAIDHLPETFRIVFMMRVVEDMSVEEVAVALGLPPATVKTRLHRARARLKKDIETRVGAVLTEAFSFDGARCGRMTERVLATLSLPPSMP
jgi:RNA polymerase sigma-70 factor, ECF subfamily